MSRSARAAMAQETVAILGRGTYPAPGGGVVDLADAVRECLDATRLLEPGELERARRRVLANPAAGFDTAIEVARESTLEGIARVLADGRGPVAALNFASAKNPGGGFLRGSQAQEESLARSSALYGSLLRASGYYDRHRAAGSMLYSDALIVSPACPVFRDAAGALLDRPHRATFLTCAAPNAGAAHDRPAELAQIPDVIRRRSEYVLAAAAALGETRLVLGAWGCGVFRNDPGVVAEAFAAHLRGEWAGRFERIVFSILDREPSGATFEAFELALLRGR